jgi:hypothetical protein
VKELKRGRKARIPKPGERPSRNKCPGRKGGDEYARWRLNGRVGDEKSGKNKRRRF